MTTRRGYLAIGGALGAGLLAGCSESASETGGESDDEEEATETEPPASTPGSSDQTPTPDASPEPEDTPEASDSDPVSDWDTPKTFDSFAVEGYMEDPERTIELESRNDGEDFYHRYVLPDGEVMELSEVDDTKYIVTDGSCFIQEPTMTVPDQSSYSSEGYWSDKEVVRTEEVDGMEMAVYEFTTQTSSYSTEHTVFVRMSDGYLYRFRQYVPEEQALSVGTLHSWGDADPVRKPDVECQSTNF